MFQLDKTENKTSSKTSSILGPELEIHGDVIVSGSLLIYGKIFGNIKSNGAVRTATGSEVKGIIIAKEVTIGGKVEGDIEAVKKVTLGDTSILTGNLNASTLTIEEGAKFEGVCNMKDKSSKQQMDNSKN